MLYDFYRGETPSFIATCKNFTVDEIQTARLAIHNVANVSIKDMADLTIDAFNNQIRYDLTQEETLAFVPLSYVTFELTLLTHDKRFEVSEKSWRVGDTFVNEVITDD